VCLKIYGSKDDVVSIDLRAALRMTTSLKLQSPTNVESTHDENKEKEKACVHANRRADPIHIILFSHEIPNDEFGMSCPLPCCKRKSRQNHDSNAQVSHSRRQLTRVKLNNAPHLGLRIGGRGRQMNSKVGIQTNKAKLDVY
jgi:hypothetical protein